MKGPGRPPNLPVTVVDKPEGDGDGGRPEAARLMLTMFAVAAGLEVIALILNVVTTVVDPAPLMSAAREAADDTGPLVEATAWGSVAIVTLFYLVVVAILTAAIVAIHKNGKWAAGALRLWTIFAIYFAFRGLTVFLITPAGGNAPDALFLADGAVQILVGVAAVLGAVFGSRPDTRAWLTTPDDRT
jgi:hypothetical protein